MSRSHASASAIAVSSELTFGSTNRQRTPHAAWYIHAADSDSDSDISRQQQHHSSAYCPFLSSLWCRDTPKKKRIMNMMYMPPMSPTERPFQSGVQVFIPAALNRPTHTLYSICMVVQPAAQEWTVNRRYSQFLQLKKDLLAALAKKARCPGCLSFHIALSKFAFPPKALLRTNAVVRRRVTALQGFLQLLVERIFNDLPKCAICGDDAKKLVRPFLIRGAQPIGPSILSKIQQALSLRSFAYVPRTIPGPGPMAYPSKQEKNKKTDDLSNTMSNGSDDSYTSTQRNDSDDPIMELPSSPTQSEYASSDASSDDVYAKKYGDERCTDSKVSIEEAMKNIVLPKGVRATYEEVLIRLSSMWDAYEDMEAVLASIPPERLSQRLSATMESCEEVTL